MELKNSGSTLAQILRAAGWGSSDFRASCISYRARRSTFAQFYRIATLTSPPTATRRAILFSHQMTKAQGRIRTINLSQL